MGEEKPSVYCWHRQLFHILDDVGIQKWETVGLLVKLEVGVELEVSVKQQVGLRSAAQLLSNPAKLLQARRFFGVFRSGAIVDGKY